MKASRNRVNRLCTVARIWSVHSRKRGRYRVPGPPVHDDLVAGVFRAQAPNQVWFTTNVTDGLGNKADASYTSDSNVAKYSTGNASASGQLNYDGLNNLIDRVIAKH